MPKRTDFRWQFKRFFAAKIQRQNHSTPPIVLVSLPKSGTNLIERLFVETGASSRIVRPTLPDDVATSGSIARIINGVSRNRFLTCHIGYKSDYDEALSGKVVVLMLRHPIAIAASYIKYMEKEKGHKQYGTFGSASSLDEKISLLLNGNPESGLRPFASTLDRYTEWIEHASIVITFEDLVGPLGGGSQESKNSTIEGFLEMIGCSKMPIGKFKVFSSDAPTFSDGKVDGYTQFFSEAQIKRIGRNVRLQSERLGYNGEG